jgi:hypothetical protein
VLNLSGGVGRSGLHYLLPSSFLCKVQEYSYVAET